MLVGWTGSGSGGCCPWWSFWPSCDIGAVEVSWRAGSFPPVMHVQTAPPPGGLCQHRGIGQRVACFSKVDFKAMYFIAMYFIAMYFIAMYFNQLYCWNGMSITEHRCGGSCREVFGYVRFDFRIVLFIYFLLQESYRVCWVVVFRPPRPLAWCRSR
jgi:hypothetical protein